MWRVVHYDPLSSTLRTAQRVPRTSARSQIYARANATHAADLAAPSRLPSVPTPRLQPGRKVRRHFRARHALR